MTIPPVDPVSPVSRQEGVSLHLTAPLPAQPMQLQQELFEQLMTQAGFQVLGSTQAAGQGEDDES